MQLWERIFIKKEPTNHIPARFEFSENGELVMILRPDGDRPSSGGMWISDYRVRESKKRFRELSYAEWDLLPSGLQTVHPEYREYLEERRKLVSSKKRPTTPIQAEAWGLCANGDHSWMIPRSRFDGVAFEAAAWIEGNTVYEARKCYCCDERVSTEDPGGAPFYSGKLDEKPARANGTPLDR